MGYEERFLEGHFTIFEVRPLEIHCYFIHWLTVVWTIFPKLSESGGWACRQQP